MTGTLYAGVTQNRGGADTTDFPDSLGGVFRLKPGDGEWEHLSEGMPAGSQALCLTVAPGGAVYAGTHEGAYVSEDGGDRWRRLPLPLVQAVYSITLHPENPRTIFCGLSPIGIWRSDDAGATWRALGVRMPDRIDTGIFFDRVMRIAIDPVRPNEMYAATEINGAARSTDGGETWQDCSDGLVRLAGERPDLRNAILSSDELEGLLDAHAIAVSPARPGSAVIANRVGLFRTEDLGARWTDVGTRRHTDLAYARDIRVSPHDPATLYACLSIAADSETGGLYRSTDVGETWQRFDRGVKPDGTVMAVATDPRDANSVFCTTRRGQVLATRDGGASWQTHRLPEQCRSVMALACG
ncbi:MAG: WD40/YVTN/BNR-like repeat-containing protein [Alphaproteobacteria bacterium]